jgi:DNA-directed RNA polymerase subunit RPC12/RpoP
MGLKCLLGHDFGEREVERERREAGDEVVVVYRTVENCARCGERRIVSENKEVRSVEAAAAAAAGTGDTDDAGADTDAAADGPGAAESLVAAAEAVGAREATDAGTDGSSTGDVASAPAGGGAEAAGAESAPAGTGRPDDPDPAEEDAVILGSTGAETAAGGGAEAAGASERAPAGADAEAEADADGSDWPTPTDDAADEGFDAAPPDAEGSGVEFGGGLAPSGDEEGETDPDPSPHASFVGTTDGSGADAADAAGEADGDAGFARPERRAVESEAGPTEYRCANCGASRPTASSSLRAGDVCPDCRKGYVAERPAGE